MNHPTLQLRHDDAKGRFYKVDERRSNALIGFGCNKIEAKKFGQKNVAQQNCV